VKYPKRRFKQAKIDLGTYKYYTSGATSLEECKLQCLNTWDKDIGACSSVAYNSYATSDTDNCHLSSYRHVRDDAGATFVYASAQFDYYEVDSFNEPRSTGKGVCSHEVAKEGDWKVVAKCKYHRYDSTGCSSATGCSYIATGTTTDSFW